MKTKKSANNTVETNEEKTIDLDLYEEEIAILEEVNKEGKISALWEDVAGSYAMTDAIKTSILAEITRLQTLINETEAKLKTERSKLSSGEDMTKKQALFRKLVASFSTMGIPVMLETILPAMHKTFPPPLVLTPVESISGGDVNVKILLKHLTREPQSSGELQKASKLSAAQIRAAIAKLGNKLRSEGDRRAKKYWLA